MSTTVNITTMNTSTMIEIIMPVTTMSTKSTMSTMVMFGDCFTVFVTNLDRNLDLFDHLKRNGFGEVHWNLDRFHVLEGLGDGNVFHNGDLDRDFDGVGF